MLIMIKVKKKWKIFLYVPSILLERQFKIDPFLGRFTACAL